MTHTCMHCTIRWLRRVVTNDMLRRAREMHGSLENGAKRARPQSHASRPPMSAIIHEILQTPPLASVQGHITDRVTFS